MRTKKTKLKTQDANQGLSFMYHQTSEPLFPAIFMYPLPFPFKKHHSPSLPSPFSPPNISFFPLHFPCTCVPPPPLIFPIQREQRVSPATRNMQHATVEGFSVVVFCCVLFSFLFLCVFFTPEVLGHEFNPTGVSGSRKSPICGKFSTNLACTYLRNFLGNCKIVSYQQYFLQYFRHVSFHRIFF